VIKKTPEAPKPPADTTQEDYEALRTYVLSPFKTPLRPLGLDLWSRKGFLAWSLTVFQNNPPSAYTNRVVPEATEAPLALVIPLTNIINDWSDRHVRPNYEFENQT
jgi:hypothetical protein